MKEQFLFLLLAAATLLAGCARGQESTTGGERPTSGMEHNGVGMGKEGQFAFGAPADQSDAARTISISALDTLRFDPSEIEVRKDETVTFEVTNVGQTVHEFTLGDEAFQKQHGEEMMASPAMMEDAANSILLQPGETRRVTWKFTAAGKVLFGCHQPGHYEGGMVGSISVT